MSLTQINNITDFEKLIAEKTSLAAIDFYADWCGPCKIMTPIFEKLSEMEEVKNITFYKINRDENAELIEKYGFEIPTIPRFFLVKFTGDGVFDKSNILEALGGTQSKTDMLEKILKKVIDNTNLPKTEGSLQVSKIMSENHKPRVAIIGSGPAGLTAAIYTSRANLETKVFMGLEPGGQLTTTTEIENFPGAWSKETKEGMMGPDLMALMQKQAEHFGAEMELTEVRSLSQKTKENGKPEFSLDTGGRTETFDAVIIASGASAKYLGVPGEEKFVGKGYHSCATCDGFFYKGKTIAVVGGGDSAMEEANFLTKFAQKVYLIHRRGEFKASKIMLERAKKNPKIEFILYKSIASFTGENKVDGVILHDTKAEYTAKGENIEYDSFPEGRVFLEDNLEKVSDGEYKLVLDGVFVAIGHNPNTNFVGNLLDKDAIGYLIPQGRLPVDERVSKYAMGTKIPGLFVAGDVEDSYYRQAITAAGDGCRAAIECEKWLEEID